MTGCLFLRFWRQCHWLCFHKKITFNCQERLDFVEVVSYMQVLRWNCCSKVSNIDFLSQLSFIVSQIHEDQHSIASLSDQKASHMIIKRHMLIIKVVSLIHLNLSIFSQIRLVNVYKLTKISVNDPFREHPSSLQTFGLRDNSLKLWTLAKQL